MKKVKVFLSVLLLVFLTSGCASLTEVDVSEKEALRAATDMYATTLEVANDYLERGVITPKQALKIEEARKNARAALDVWRASLEQGKSTAPALFRFQKALVTLENILLNAKEEEHGSRRSRHGRASRPRIARAHTSRHCGKT